jgi:alpha-tubulin suppressor-like RCC1 family protein
VPVAVNVSGYLSGKTVSSISSGRDHTCAIASDNKAYCWGHDNIGQIGDGYPGWTTEPMEVDKTGAISGLSMSHISSSKSGYGHSCALSSDNHAYCWGSNGSGELGVGNWTVNMSPAPIGIYYDGVLLGKTIKSISTGSYYSCAIASDDMAYCWGSNSYGQLGNNSTSTSNGPVAVYTSGVLSGKTIKSISAGGNHTCAIASDDQAYCWGGGDYGKLGNNAVTNSSVPVAVYTAGVLSGKTIKSISTGNYHTCAVASDNMAYCWGYGYYGQLGNNANGNSSVPVAVDAAGDLAGKTIKSISAGGNYNCAIAIDDQAYCWGYNDDGQFGNNSTNGSWVPVAVYTSGFLSGKTVKSISAGFYSTVCAIASNDQIYCWGGGGNGELGNGGFVNSLAPVPVARSGALFGKTIKEVSVGDEHVSVVASDNKVYYWGYFYDASLTPNAVVGP